MNEKEFRQGMSILIETYGEKYYPDRRLEQIWYHVNELDAHTFKIGLERLAGEQNYAPLPQKISMALRADLERVKADKRVHAVGSCNCHKYQKSMPLSGASSTPAL